jgi:hypothetical protein
MGAGILPTTIIDNKLFFLFGKENKYEDSAPGFSDFGGGTDDNETYLQTAIREGGEELTGFLGSGITLKKMLKKHGTFNIDHKTGGHKLYRMHIFPMEYNPFLELYYNNNQAFLQKKLDPDVIRNSKIFEKAEIRWICIDDLKTRKSEFRRYFRDIIDLILEKRESIYSFIMKKDKTRNKTRKNRK